MSDENNKIPGGETRELVSVAREDIREIKQSLQSMAADVSDLKVAVAVGVERDKKIEEVDQLAKENQKAIGDLKVSRGKLLGLMAGSGAGGAGVMAGIAKLLGLKIGG